jgi:hypothetical protein
METITGFITLFRGRGDCYGSEAGGCVRLPLDRDAFIAHLEGRTPIGVYPSVPKQGAEPFCVWGCSDIDIESIADARLIQRTLEAAGVVSWVERSRSKGYHVWVFADNPVTSKVMRNALLMAHQVADYPAREVNPKQVDVSASKVGNYVRLPYVGGLVATPERRVILDDNDQPVHLDIFVRVALELRTSATRLEEIASMWVEPKVSRVILDIESSEDLDSSLRMASPLARIIWRDGPLEGQDRSTALTRLAHVCSRSDVTPSMARVIVASADQRWGKYHLRGEAGQTELDKIIQRAYGNK